MILYHEYNLWAIEFRPAQCVVFGPIHCHYHTKLCCHHFERPYFEYAMAKMHLVPLKHRHRLFHLHILLMQHSICAVNPIDHQSDMYLKWKKNIQQIRFQCYLFKSKCKKARIHEISIFVQNIS